jgi:hypothetical protein
MKYIQILTLDNEYFSINLDQQSYIKISGDDEVLFFSNNYQLVFTSTEKIRYITAIRISQDTMDMLQDAIIDAVDIITDPNC